MIDLPKVYPITDTEISGLSHAEQLARLADGGATLIQLREKNLSPAQFFREATDAIQLGRQRGVRVIINDRVDIALTLRADGVHIGQDDMPPEAARSLLGKEFIIGFSTHSVEEARQAVKLPVDYLAIGPIFPTKTKSDHEPTVGLVGLSAVRRAVGDFPIVAIGGITLATAPDVIDAGASTVAMIGALLSPSDLTTKLVRDLLQTLDRHPK
jgi:thiamine-phosphate pyrophosphorylase